MKSVANSSNIKRKLTLIFQEHFQRLKNKDIIKILSMKPALYNSKAKQRHNKENYKPISVINTDDKFSIKY